LSKSDYFCCYFCCDYDFGLGSCFEKTIGRDDEAKDHLAVREVEDLSSPSVVDLSTLWAVQEVLPSNFDWGVDPFHRNHEQEVRLDEGHHHDDSFLATANDDDFLCDA
jgi:hypothetical protein